MHPNPIYRKAARDRNLAFAAQRAFGTLMVNGADGPMASHVPFLLAPDGHSADLHLVRSNPIARALSGPQPALIAVTGADTYISPDWYGMEHQVPTWNYVSVHLRGSLTVLPDTALHDLLDRQSAEFEARLLPKTPWLTSKMPQDTMARMMRQIVPVRFDIGSVDGTWKLSQNKPAAARQSAAKEAGKTGFGADVGLISDLMHDFNDDDS